MLLTQWKVQQRKIYKLDSLSFKMIGYDKHNTKKRKENCTSFKDSASRPAPYLFCSVTHHNLPVLFESCILIIFASLLWACLHTLCTDNTTKHWFQGRGKVFYVGGAVGWGGGGCSQFLRINITPNRNRKSCYSLRTFMRSC